MDNKDGLRRSRSLGETITHLRTHLPGVFRVVVWSVSLALLAAIALPFLLYQLLRPKDWNTQAFVVKTVRAEVAGSAIVFTVDLENGTDDDLTLTPSVRFMTAARENGALQDSALKLDKDYFLPKQHISRVQLWVEGVCADREDFRACYRENFGDDREIVLFDESPRIEGHIPVPATVPAGTVHFPAADDGHVQDQPASNDAPSNAPDR